MSVFSPIRWMSVTFFFFFLIFHACNSASAVLVSFPWWCFYILVMLERLGWSSTGLSIVNWIKLFPCHEWIHMDVYNGHTYMYMYVYMSVCVCLYIHFLVFFDGFLSELDFIAFLWKLKPDFFCNNQINKKKQKVFS